MTRSQGISKAGNSWARRILIPVIRHRTAASLWNPRADGGTQNRGPALHSSGLRKGQSDNEKARGVDFLEARVAEQLDELGRVGRLKRFLAPQLAELIVSQGDEKILESHRREIVVVFCDLRGYTAFTETAEPQEILDFLRQYHGALGPLVSQFKVHSTSFRATGLWRFSTILC